jgi:CheY-like chemotaxis protein
MIVIDENANGKLIRALEALRIESDAVRCVHFKFPVQDVVALDKRAFRHQVVTAVEQRLPALPSQIYMCDDGDVFVLASEMPGKSARQMMLDIGGYLQLPVDEHLASLYELDVHINKVLLMVEEKIEQHRKHEEAQRKQAQHEEFERKRKAILSSVSLSEKVPDIAARRVARTTVELMLVEDDMFSRHLVERTLQKIHPITSLSSAELALDTYTRLAPDIVFLDINLPDVTGHELLEKFIAIDPDAYIVMLSGNADRANITTAMARGAKGFVAKPFTIDKLLQYINVCPTIRKKREDHARTY